MLISRRVVRPSGHLRDGAVEPHNRSSGCAIALTRRRQRFADGKRYRLVAPSMAIGQYRGRIAALSGDHADLGQWLAAH